MNSNNEMSFDNLYYFERKFSAILPAATVTNIMPVWTVVHVQFCIYFDWPKYDNGRQAFTNQHLRPSFSTVFVYCEHKSASYIK